MKTKAGFLAATISAVIAALSWLIPWMFKK